VTGIWVATALLTRVPVRVVAGAHEVGRAARWFPLVGGALGGTAALAAWGLRDVMGVPPSLSAALLVSFGAWITGAIHLDGLADMADGFGGGSTRDDVLRIMRDPAIGSYGAVTVATLITLKVTALATLLERNAALPFVVAAPVMSRWTIVALGTWLPYARVEGGIGQAVTRVSGLTGLLVATATTFAIAFAVLRTAAILPWTLAAVSALMLGRAAKSRIGGVTGDVFGASVELAETTALVGGVLLTGHT